MTEFGNTLREAREAKGYTIGQLAEATHLMHQIIEDMENENFSKIAAPIYGRGFVKLYCEAVDIDPKPLIAEYMAIVNGERPATIHIRRPSPVSAPPPPPPPPPPEPAPEPKPTQTSFDQIVTPAPTADSQAEAPLPQPKPQINDEPLPEPVRRYTPPRLQSPLPEAKPYATIPKMPPNTWRIAVVAGVAALLLWALAVGARALYRATMSGPEEVQPPEKAVETPPPPQPVEPAADGERKPIEIPPLYID